MKPHVDKKDPGVRLTRAEKDIERLKRRPVPRIPTTFLGGPGLADGLFAAGFDAIWPHDDAIGSVIARDLSGNGLDLSVPSSFGAPTFGEAAGPPATLTALYDHTANAQLARAVADYPSLIGDFTAVLWAKRPTWGGGGTIPGTDLIGQGGFGGQGTGHSGWSVTRNANNSTDRFVLFVGNPSTPHTIVNANAVPDAIWYFLAITRASGVWSLYLDGLFEASYTEGTYNPASGGIWVGNGASNSAANDVWVSWAALNGTRALSGGEILDLYTRGVAHGFPAGRKVWTSLGDGSDPGWQDETIEVEY